MTLAQNHRGMCRAYNSALCWNCTSQQEDIFLPAHNVIHLQRGNINRIFKSNCDENFSSINGEKGQGIKHHKRKNLNIVWVFIHATHPHAPEESLFAECFGYHR
jgi:hypothetical protein